MDIRRIDPKVLVPYVTGHIGTITAVLLALLKIVHVDPTQVLIIGEAATNALGFIGYMTKNGLPHEIVMDAQAIAKGVVKASAPQGQESGMAG